MIHAIKKSSSLRTALVCLTLLALPATASAGVYKWVDENGKVHFGDRPPADAEKQEIKGRISTYNAGPTTQSTESDTTTPPKVTMYSTSWCGYCHKARAHFRANNIQFRELDIEKNSRANREYHKLGGKGVPLIVVGTQLLSGFSPDRFDSAYAQK